MYTSIRQITSSAMITLAMGLSTMAADLKLDGTVVNSDQVPLKGVEVIVRSEHGKALVTAKTNKDGQFDVVIDFDQKVDVEFRLNGYRVKIIHVNTFNVPKDEQVIGHEFGGFKVVLILGDGTAPPEVAGTIAYSPEVSTFSATKEE